jgi:tetratricopeptide (TPR) repeat protein
MFNIFGNMYESYLDSLIEQNHKNPAFYIFKASKLRECGRYADAVDCFSKALELDPKDSVSHNNKGSLLQDLYKPKEALECFNRALEINPKYPKAHTGKGTALKNLGKYKESIISHDMAIKYEKNNHASLNGKGLSLQALKQHEEALLCIKKAIEINPYFSPYYSNVASILINLARYDEAILYCDKALSIDDFPFAHINKLSALISLGKTENILQACDKTLVSTEKLFKSGKHEQALEVSEKLLTILDEKFISGSKDLYSVMGIICLHLNQPKKALNYFDLAINSDIEIHYYRANCFFQMERYKEAIESLNIHLKINPGDTKAEFALIQSQIKIGTVAQMPMLVSLLMKTSKDKKLTEFINKISYEQNDNELLFKQLIEHIEKSDCSEANSHFFKACRLYDDGKHQDAIPEFEDALKFEKNNEQKASIYCLYGGSLYRLKEYKTAIKILDKGLHINPYNSQILYFKGLCLLELNEYQEAIMYCKKALELDEHYAEAYNGLGCCLNRIGKYDDALLSFNKCIDLNQKTEGVLSNKGAALHGLGKYKEALEYYNKAEIEDPANVNTIFMNKAITLHRLCQYSDALLFYNKAIEIDEKDAEAYCNKAVTLSLIGRKLEAITCLEKAIEINKNDSNAYVRKGIILCELGKFLEAIESMFKALSIKPDDSYIFYNIARTFISLGRYDLSETYIDRIDNTVNAGLENNNSISEIGQFKEKSFNSENLDCSTTIPLQFPKYHDNAKLKEKEVSNEQRTDLSELSENSHKKLDDLINEYLNSTDALKKQDVKNQINYEVDQNPSLKGFLVHLFKTSTSDDQLASFEEIFSNDPSLLHKFYQHKKEYLKAICSVRKNSKEYCIKISDEIEGTHKIKTSVNFKSSWFFKFSKKIIDKLSDMGVLKKLQSSINDLSIVEEDMKAKIGFKKHDIQTECKKIFSLLKLVGMKKDHEIYSKTTYKYYDVINCKTDTLSILDDVSNHKQIKKIINGSKNINFREEYLNLDEFITYLSGEVEECCIKVE